MTIKTPANVCTGEGRSQDFPWGGGGGLSDCFREMFTSSTRQTRMNQ